MGTCKALGAVGLASTRLLRLSPSTVVDLNVATTQIQVFRCKQIQHLGT